MSVELYRESPGKFDSRTLNRKTLNRWTGRIISVHARPRQAGEREGGVHRKRKDPLLFGAFGFRSSGLRVLGFTVFFIFFFSI